MSRRRIRVIIVCTVVALVAAGSLFWFQPWKLWVDTRVDEALPVVSATASATSSLPSATSGGTPRSVAASITGPAIAESVTPTSSTAGSDPAPTGWTATTDSPASTSAPSSIESSAPAGPVVLRSGTLISHEHETSGQVAVVALPDGSRVLTLENLSTSDGPDVRVWLSAAPVIPGEAGWYTFADAPHTDLGALKGNLGNQVYEIPADVDLDALPNVSLWCQRFSVSFGAAELRA